MVFDEFQDVLGAQERSDAVIRSEIQHHGDAAAYVFAGSHVGMMRELFATPRARSTARRARWSWARWRPRMPRSTWPSISAHGNRDVGAALELLLASGAGPPPADHAAGPRRLGRDAGGGRRPRRRWPPRRTT